MTEKPEPVSAHWFPWTILRPWSWRIYYACPEIRWHLNEASKCRVKKWAWFVTAFPLAVLPVVVGTAFKWVGEFLLSTYPHDADIEAIRSAHEILSVDEIRRRIGKPSLPSLNVGKP